MFVFSESGLNGIHIEVLSENTNNVSENVYRREGLGMIIKEE